MNRTTTTTMNLTGRLGRWSAQHRWKALLGWIALVLVASVLGGVGAKHLSAADVRNGDSARAERLLDEGGFVQPAAEQVLVHAPKGATVRSPEGRAAIAATVEAVRETGRVRDVRSPFATGNGGQISSDGRSALVLFAIKGEAETAKDRIVSVTDAVARVASAHPQYTIDEFGSASAGRALDDTIGRDFKRAETLSIPLTLLILVIAFGALVAALVPVVLALSAIFIAGGMLAVTSHALPIDDSAGSMILLIGLAVGVDYSLFYSRRTREERAGGASVKDAIATAAATSGRAVLTSGLAVIAAMAAMFLTGQGTFIGMAEATALVVAVAMLGSLTVLPALLSLLGDRVERGRIPVLGRRLQRRQAEEQSRFWAAVVRPALRHPVLVGAATVTLLLVLAFPATRLQTAQLGASDIPRDQPIMQTFERIQRAFPGGPQPAQVVISAPSVNTPAVENAITRFERQALATGRMHEPITVEVNPKRTIAVVSVPLDGNGVDEASRTALTELRNTVVPATVGAVATAYVGGATASSVDFNDQLSSRAPLVFAFVLGLAFVLLLWSFRSIVIPATAIVLNLLSVGAAYGVLVAVFQWGWGGSLIGLEQHGPITSWLPLFLFVILFGLSMDYHVFILSRIREGRDRGLSTHEAIERGITRSAGVITSAAIVMVAVFATFATLSLVSMKQLGVGLAVAILLDATIVRGLLLPAAMALLGERNWYLPRWLDRSRPRHAQPRVGQPLGKEG